ncbi:protein phosphatase 2C domain-containing protein [Nocardia sp. NEAU-351]|uniref:Protein phosphatase 2C domain-containing protein n=1 Tax=Nocardia bovistercoris TaxID=2785916 RepID=A0A931I765_9NOCA|nr:protein phosphatase 2C domain-containing protein [Nocardia bovistercoris]
MCSAMTTTRRELVRLTGIAGDSVSKRGSRAINADAVATWTDPTSGRAAFVVADGVGDHLPAARAARAAATVAAREAARGGDAAEGILAAQRHLLREFPEPKADSALVVAVLPTTDRDDAPADIAWVGDCRAYRWNGRTLHQITTDHTLAEYLRLRGRYAAPRTHHIITTTVRTVRPDQIGRAATGSSNGRLLLSTDGVHKPLGIAAIKAALACGESAQATADGLVELALHSGGRDNASAFVIDRR